MDIQVFSYIVYIVPLILLLWRAIYQRRSSAEEPPLIRGWIPWIGCGLSFKRNPYIFLKNARTKYGAVFTVYMGGRYLTFVTDPRCYNELHRAKSCLTFEPIREEMFRRVFDGVLEEGVIVEPMRESMLRHLQGHGLANTNENTLRNLRSVLEREKFRHADWSVTSLLDFTLAIMFPAVFKTLFGDWSTIEGGDDNRNEAITSIISDFVEFDSQFVEQASGYPVKDKKRLSRVKERLKEFCSNDAESSSEMIAARYQYLKEMKQHARIPSEGLSILWAAQANTIPALFWTIYFLLKHPDAYRAVRCEIERVKDKYNQKEIKDILASKTCLDEMTVLDSVLKETLRLSSAPMSVRTVVENFRLSVHQLDISYNIRKGATLIVVNGLTHMDADVYRNPDQFDFRRFLNEDGTEKKIFYKDGKRIQYALEPFGSGESKCPGRYWAVAELKQAVCLLLTTFDMELVNPKEEVDISYSRYGFGILHPTVKPKIRFRLRN